MSRMMPSTTMARPAIFFVDRACPNIKIEIRIEKSFLVDVTMLKNSELKAIIANMMKNDPMAPHMFCLKMSFMTYGSLRIN